VEIGSSTSSSVADLQKQLQADQRTLVQHQRAGAADTVIAADQAQIVQDQMAIAAAQMSSTASDGTGGTVDVLA
jgi:hypothetical protein